MTMVNGTDFETMGAAERAALRELFEAGHVTEVSEDLRKFIEIEMPDLVDKLPPRVTN